VTIVAGPGYTHALDPSLGTKQRVHVLRNPSNIRGVMENADIAVIAGGGTLWELLHLGCVVLSYSRNSVQRRIVQELAAKKAVHDLGATQKFNAAALTGAVIGIMKSKEIRQGMSKAGQKVLDGQGTKRVLRTMRELETQAPMVSMVAIEITDRKEFMKIARQHFRELDSSFVPHDDWEREYFENIRSNPNFFLRWILYKGVRAGFILFGIENHRFLPRKTGMIYELYIAPGFRQRGIARVCAAQAICELQALGPSKIQLEVMEGNHAAVALWKSLHFRKVSERFVLVKEAQ
jgi:ribosomal protein S18 acetylase RimI-like enzyme